MEQSFEYYVSAHGAFLFPLFIGVVIVSMVAAYGGIFIWTWKSFMEVRKLYDQWKRDRKKD